MATVIARDHNRYEVVQVINPDDAILKVTTTSPPPGESSAATDAFGRLRISQPLTLFDSSHRYADNGLWVTSTATPYELTLIAAASNNGADIYASMDWEEISR